MVGGDFFDIFPSKFGTGNATALNDVSNAIISRSFANRLGGESAVMGKVIDGKYTISAIFEDTPNPIFGEPDVIVSIENLTNRKNRPHMLDVIPFVKVRKGTDRAELEVKADSLAAVAGKTVLLGAVVMLFAYKLSMAGGIPTVLIWVAVIVLLYFFITGKTTIGRHFYVVGGNKEAARLSGIDTRRIMFIAYLNMAVITAITTFTVIARFQAANSTAGTNYEMDAISACFVGGASAYGGAGTVPGMMVGALLIGVINLGMSLMGIDANLQKVVKGVVLLGAVAFDIISKKNAK